MEKVLIRQPDERDGGQGQNCGEKDAGLCKARRKIRQEAHQSRQGEEKEVIDQHHNWSGKRLHSLNRRLQLAVEVVG